MIKKISITLIKSFFILFYSGYIVGFLHYNFLSGLMFNKISKLTSTSDYFQSNLDNLNDYILFNSHQGGDINESYFPIMDKRRLLLQNDGVLILPIIILLTVYTLVLLYIQNFLASINLITYIVVHLNF